jgi:hypothetical protein
MKSQIHFGTEYLTKILIIIIGFFILTSIIISQSGGLRSIMDKFCESFPQLCGKRTTPTDLQIARQSRDALLCAIDSVGGGKESECMEELQENSITEFGISEGATIECEGGPEETRALGASVDEACKNCPPGYKCSDFPDCKLVGGEDIGTQMECKCETEGIPVKKCKVTNFRLPQEVSAPEKWIKGWGDPKFLVYWEQFPSGEEEAWSGIPTWISNAVDIAFAWFAVGKAFRIGAMTAKLVVGQAGKRIASKVAASTSRELLARHLTRYAEKQTIKNAANEISKIVGPWLSKRLVIVAGVSTSAAIVAAHLESKVAKYDLQPNSLVLKSPYEEPEPKKSEFKGPVFIDGIRSMRRRRWGHIDKTFYLASPCSANLTVEKHVINCGNYSYDMIDDIYGCLNPKFTNEKSIKEGERCSSDIRKVFPPGDYIPERIAQLDTREELKICEKNDDVVSFRDPISRATFKFKEDKNQKILLYEVIFEKGESEKEICKAEHHYRDIFGLNILKDTNTVKCSNFNITFGQDECTGKKDTENFACRVGKPIANPIKFEKDETKCDEYCEELENYFDTLDIIVYTPKYEKMPQAQEEWTCGISRVESFEESTCKVIESKLLPTEVKYAGVHIRYKDKKNSYWVVFLDADMNGTADVITVDPISNWDRIAKLHPLSYFWHVKTHKPKVILIDDNSDGKMDYINVLNCKIIGERIDVVKNEVPKGSYNFCARQTDIIRKVTRYAPEIGIGVGAALGTISGVPGATIAGMKAGTWIGATILTAYVGYEKWAGTAEFWPGERWTR